MATATSIKPILKAISHSTNPLTLWHLLSLDAPTVAVLWTWFIASANHIHLSITSALSMAITVWMLYAADRLMDARLVDSSPTRHEDLEPRHHFHHHHRKVFVTGIVVASIALAILLPQLEVQAIHLYLILGGAVCGYFIVIHATHSAHRLPKEIAVGLCFAAATFIPTVARRPDLRLALLPSAILFATLCSLNCLFIYAWEHEHHHTPQPTHAITRMALSHLPSLATLLTVAGLALTLFDHHAPRVIPCAAAMAATLLLFLQHHRRSLERTTLRAAADLALTTPLLLMPFLHP